MKYFARMPDKAKASVRYNLMRAGLDPEAIYEVEGDFAEELYKKIAEENEDDVAGAGTNFKEGTEVEGMGIVLWGEDLSEKQFFLRKMGGISYIKLKKPKSKEETKE